jgi:hypothetical protein
MHVLSLPTWWVHLSSLVEWIAAIFMVWVFAEAAGLRYWRWLSWAMIPSLLSAMCAISWHFFDNASQLDWAVTLQGAMTLLGNTTMAAAAGWISYRSWARRTSEEL